MNSLKPKNATSPCSNSTKPLSAAEAQRLANRNKPIIIQGESTTIVENPEPIFVERDDFTDLANPDLTGMNCRMTNSNFNKDFLLVNEEKTRFCLKIYQGFLEFEIDSFKQLVQVIKVQMDKVHYLKKFFYCAICDAHAIRFFDHDKKIMNFDPGFCQNLLQEHLDYLKFMHVVFIKFADSLLQYVQCFESDAKTLNFPFQNFLIKYKRRIPFFEKCFKEIENESAQFMNSCWFICNKFSLVRISTIFDGDLVLMQRIRVALASFLRKFGRERQEHDRQEQRKSRRRPYSFDLGLLNNVNGLLAEPVAPAFLVSEGKFILNDIDRPKVLGNFTIRGDMTPTPEMETAVNQFLRAVRVGNVRAVRKMEGQQWRRGHRRFMRRLNSTFEGDVGAYRVSPVNKLINELYNVTLRVNVSDHMFPRRELRQTVVGIFRQNGLEPPPTPRELQQQTGRNSTAGGRTNSTRRVRTAGSIMIDEGLKTVERAIHNPREPLPPKKPQPAPLPGTEHIDPENFNEFYEKEKPRIDLFNYGTIMLKEGLHPIKFYSLINFMGNTTELIGRHFRPAEKIEREVMQEYMSNNARRINEFNAEIEQDNHPDAEVKIRYKHINKLQEIKDWGESRMRPGVFNIANNRQKKMISTQQYNLREEAKRKANEKAALEYARRQEIDKMTRNSMVFDHVKHKAYNTTFGEILDIFKHLFGE